jgi:hypothetical protein
MQNLMLFRKPGPLRMAGWVCLLTLSWLTCTAAAGESEAGFLPMFNGRDLTGWEGKPGGWWVEEGALTAQSTQEKPCTACHYLMWRGGKPADFELRAEYRLIGNGANSGIQFRSRELPNWDTSGYQADMEVGTQWTGCLFEHIRGGVAMRGEKVLIDKDGKKKIECLGDPQKLLKRAADRAPITPPAEGPASRGAELLKNVKMSDWNTYRIVARGPHITLEINGVMMCEVTDHQAGQAAREGVIALQMHPGPPMKVQFRNLRIKILDSRVP